MPQTTTAARAVRTMAIARAGLGLVLYIAPDTGTRLLGLDPQPNRQLRIGARAFGARDVALGVALLSVTGPSQRVLFHTCVSIEAFDTLTTLLARRSGTIGPRATATLLGAIAAAAIPEGIALAAGRRT